MMCAEMFQTRTKTMGQKALLEKYSLAAQEIPHILWDLKVRFFICKSLVAII
jgi:hypothetical protein